MPRFECRRRRGSRRKAAPTTIQAEANLGVSLPSPMKRGKHLGFIIVTAMLVAVGGWPLISQWQQRMVLQAELASARVEGDELQRLRAENRRLRERQIPDTELERLRADHAALPRLRAEFEAMKPR